jgi:hypothetical protein
LGDIESHAHCDCISADTSISKTFGGLFYPEAWERDGLYPLTIPTIAPQAECGQRTSTFRREPF